MRALIRVKITARHNALPPREHREAYDKAIIALFRDIGYDPRTVEGSGAIPTQDELANSKEVKHLFENLLDTDEKIVGEEMKHLVMLGYTSAGQAMFVVCSINQDVLHIRVRDDLFEKLRQACSELCGEAWTHEHKYWVSGLLLQKSPAAALRLNDTIEVMEPHHKTATIRGHLVRSAIGATWKYYAAERNLALVTLGIALMLFWNTPQLAPPLTDFLARFKTFDNAYVQSAIERISSAFLITAAVTMLELTIKFFDLRRAKPIMWNAGIEPSRGPSTKP